MIDKKIHYCWFGGKELPKEAKKCIKSWQTNCPEYEIVEWNEKNYDVNKNAYTKYCYENKLWAFLTDYVRLDVIYEFGGIYLDTDVELIKSLDDLLKNKCFMGMEQPGKVATGLGFGAVKKHKFIKENKEYYENSNFLDVNGKWIKKTCVEITTNLLKKQGLKKENNIQLINNVKIYPTDYFCPIKLGTNKINITSNTFSIHHYSASWYKGNKYIKKLNYYLIPIKQFIKKIYIKDSD